MSDENQNQSNYFGQSKRTETSSSKPIKTWSNLHEADTKRGKMCTHEPQLVLVALLIGWKSGAQTLNQSLSEVMQNQIYFADYFRHSIKNRSIIILSLIYCVCHMIANAQKGTVV